MDTETGRFHKVKPYIKEEEYAAEHPSRVPFKIGEVVDVKGVRFKVLNCMKRGRMLLKAIPQKDRQ